MAVATREPITEMASTLTQTLAQFQMLPDQAETVGNKIATAANISNTDVRDISESLKYAGTTAEAFNKPLNDTLAILATLGDYGVKGSQAGTGINEFLSRLETPPKAAKKALADYGISIEEIKPSMHSFEEILERLSSSGMDIGSFIKLLGLDAGPKFAALFSTEGLDKYREKLKELQADNSGALQKLTDEQMGTLANIKETINGALENISLKVGEKFKPLFKDIGTWFSNSENTDMISQFMENLADGIIPEAENIISVITRLMTWFNNLPEGVRTKLAEMTGVGAALAGIAGPLLMLSAGPIYTLSSLFSILEKIAGLKLDKKASEISNIVDSLTNVATITSTTGGSKQATLPDTILGVTDDAAYMAAGIGDAGNSLLLAADKYDDDVKKAEQKITKTAKASAKSGALKDIAPSLFTAGSLYGADAHLDYGSSKKDEHWSDWAENFNQPYSDLVPSRYQGSSNLDSSITKIEESEKKLQALSAGIYGTSILSELDTPDYLKSNVVTQYDDAISKFEESEKRIKSIVKDADIEAPKFSSIGDVSNLALTATSIDRIGDSSKKTGKSIKSELIENMDEWTARDVSALFAEEADEIENIGKKTEGLSSKISGVKSSIASVPTALNGMLVASTAELSSLEGTFAAVGGPIGIAFAAAIAASAAAYLTNYGGFADNINNVISEAGSAVSNISTGNYKEAGNQAAHAFADGLGAVSDLAVTVITNIPQTGIDVTKFLGGFNEGMQQAAEGAVSALVAEFLGDLNSAGISANTFCGNVSEAIKGFSWADVGTAVNSLITGGLNTAVDISGFISSIKSELLSGDWESIGSGIKDLLTNGVLSHGWAGSLIRAGDDGVQEYVDDTKEQYKSLATKNSPLLATNTDYGDSSKWKLSSVTSPSSSGKDSSVAQLAQVLINRGYSPSLANDPDSAKVIAQSLGIDTSSGAYNANTAAVEKNTAAVKSQYDTSISITDSNKKQKDSASSLIKNITDTDQAIQVLTKSGYTQQEAIEAWNKKSSGKSEDESDGTDDVSDSTESVTKSTAKKKKSSEKLTKTFDDSVSKDEALAEILREYNGSIDAAKSEIGEVKIGNLTYKLGTTNGESVLKAANDYTAAAEKTAKNLQSGTGVIERFNAGTSFQDAINSVIDKYGTDFAGQIDIGGGLYKLGKISTGSYDTEGMENAWKFYVKGINDKATNYIEGLDNVFTGETYKSGAKKGQAKTKEMSTEQWADYTGVIRQASDGTADYTKSQNQAVKTTESTNSALASTTKSLKSITDQSDKFSTTSDQICSLGPVTKDTVDQLQGLSDQVGTIDLKSQFEALFKNVDFASILSENFSWRAADTIGRNASAKDTAEAVGQYRNQLTTNLGSELTGAASWLKNAGETLEEQSERYSNLWYKAAEIYLRDSRGIVASTTSNYDWTWRQDLKEKLSGDDYEAINTIFKTYQSYLSGLYSGKYTGDATGALSDRYGDYWYGNKWSLTGVQQYSDATEESGTSANSASKTIDTYTNSITKSGEAAKAATTGSSISPSGSEYTARSWVGKYSSDPSVSVSKLSNSPYTNQNEAGSAKAVDLNSDNIHCVFYDSNLKVPDSAVSKISTDIGSVNKSYIEQVRNSWGLNSMVGVDTGQLNTGAVDEYTAALQSSAGQIGSDISSVNGNLSSLDSAIQNLASISAAAVSQINAAVSQANSILASAVSSVSTAATPSSFATGGEVKKSGTAQVHEGEWVINRNDVNELKRSGSAPGNQISLSQHFTFGNSGSKNITAQAKANARESVRALRRLGVA